MATSTSSNVPTANGTEPDHFHQTEDFIKDIKGARYTQGGSYVSGYADSYEELQTLVNRHAQVGDRVGRSGTQGWIEGYLDYELTLMCILIPRKHVLDLMKTTGQRSLIRQMF